LREKSTEVFLLEKSIEVTSHIKSVHAACMKPHPASWDLVEEPPAEFQILEISDT
jgi:hypothetical protein